jgi:hypothetical protein
MCDQQAVSQFAAVSYTAQAGDGASQSAYFSNPLDAFAQDPLATSKTSGSVRDLLASTQLPGAMPGVSRRFSVDPSRTEDFDQDMDTVITEEDESESMMNYSAILRSQSGHPAPSRRLSLDTEESESATRRSGVVDPFATDRPETTRPNRPFHRSRQSFGNDILMPGLSDEGSLVEGSIGEDGLFASTYAPARAPSQSMESRGYNRASSRFTVRGILGWTDCFVCLLFGVGG